MSRRGDYNYGSVEKESNSQSGGRAGSGTMKKFGPAVRGNPLPGNKTMSGGVNRGTKGSPQQPSPGEA